jgi:hypothetical protein
LEESGCCCKTLHEFARMFVKLRKFASVCVRESVRASELSGACVSLRESAKF